MCLPLDNTPHIAPYKGPRRHPYAPNGLRIGMVAAFYSHWVAGLTAPIGYLMKISYLDIVSQSTKKMQIRSIFFVAAKPSSDPLASPCADRNGGIAPAALGPQVYA